MLKLNTIFFSLSMPDRAPINVFICATNFTVAILKAFVVSFLLMKSKYYVLF